MKVFDRVLLTALSAGILGLAGCVYEHPHHHHDEVVVEAEPAPVGYVYEPGYYDRGEWRGEYWVWHDSHGHAYREARAEHERRMRDWHH